MKRPSALRVTFETLVTPAGAWLAWSFDFSMLGAGHWALLVFYALAASVWSVWLWMTGLARVPASQAGVFTVFLPLAAAAVAVFALGEKVSPMHGVALALALCGVVLATTSSRQRENRDVSQ